MDSIQSRAKAHAALGDPIRLAMIDLLADADLSPGDLATRLAVPTNLLAHHLQTLETAGLIRRRRSEGDGRRTYVVRTEACDRLVRASSLPRPPRVAFVCSQNSARSQLAEAYWRTVSDIPVLSAGTQPARRVHPRAVAVARKRRLDLRGATPKILKEAVVADDLIVAVCDQAFEALDQPTRHWSVPDPARRDEDRSFDAAFAEIAERIDRFSARFAGSRM